MRVGVCPQRLHSRVACCGLGHLRDSQAHLCVRVCGERGKGGAVGFAGGSVERSFADNAVRRCFARGARRRRRITKARRLRRTAKRAGFQNLRELNGLLRRELAIG